MQPQHRYLRKWTPLGLGLIAVTALMLSASASAVVGADQATAAPKYRVLIVTAGSKKDGLTDAGVNAIKAIGKDTGTGGKFSTFVAGNPEQITDQFTETNLARYRAVIFLGTGANALLNDAQKAAFESYFHNGGGFLGIGSAVETEPGWQFYTDILGARASGKTDVQSATIKVADRVHDASKNLPEYWNRTDAWYNFTANVRGVSHVLATVVEDPFGPQPQGQVLDGIAGGTMGADHPVVWCKDYKGGRSFYTALGNTAGSFDEAAFRSQLEGAIDWTAGVARHRSTATAARPCSRTTSRSRCGQPNLSEPIGFDQLPDGRIIQTDRRGGIHLHDLTTRDVAARSARSRTTTTARTGCTAGRRQRLRDQQVGLPVLRPAERRQHHVLRRDDGPHEQLRRGLRPVEQCGPHPGRQHLRLRLLDRLLPAVALQVRRRRPGRRPGASRSRQRTADPARPGQPRRLLPRGRRHRLRQAQQPLAVTGDDSAAGSGDAGALGQSIDQRTDENQTVRVSATTTGGTFTLTFNGQTTAPLAFNATAAQIAAALQSLSNIGTGNLQAIRRPGEHRERARHLEGHLRGGERLDAHR